MRETARAIYEGAAQLTAETGLQQPRSECYSCKKRHSFPVIAVLGTLPHSQHSVIREVSPSMVGDRGSSGLAPPPHPDSWQSRFWLHKHSRINKYRGQAQMKQDNCTTFLHLLSFLCVICSASILCSQKSAILAMDKCPLSPPQHCLH